MLRQADHNVPTQEILYQQLEAAVGSKHFIKAEWQQAISQLTFHLGELEGEEEREDWFLQAEGALRYIEQSFNLNIASQANSQSATAEKQASVEVPEQVSLFIFH